MANRTEAVLAVGKLGWKLPASRQWASAADHSAAASLAANSAGGRAPSVKRSPSGSPAALALPDLPSIVVLPFANLSGDPAQGYFADGMVEDITLALGRLPGLFVIGSGSAFTYKSQTVDTRRVGAELGVRYVLRGSVRKDGKRVRISAELADASQGAQIWADRFEGEIDDIFAMQDQVAAHVSTMIAPALRTAEIDRAARKPTGNLTAYDLFLRASRHYRESVEQNRESLQLLSKATEPRPVLQRGLWPRRTLPLRPEAFRLD